VRLSEIMAIANRLAGCAQTPADSEVYLDGDVRRVFVGIDVDLSELLLARTLGAPTASSPTTQSVPAPALV
jgi:hypothetical protein